MTFASEAADEQFTGRTLLLFDKQTTPAEYNKFLAQILLDARFDLDGSGPPLEQFPYSTRYNVGIAPVPPEAISIRRYGVYGLIGFVPETILRLPSNDVGAPIDRIDIRSDPNEALQRIGTRDSAATGKGVKVAVLDTGIYPHPDFCDRIKGRKCFVNTTDITLAHGTLVAGIIGGPRRFDDGTNGYGIAPEVHLYDGQVMADRNIVSDDTLRQAIDWADQTVGADIIVFAAGRKTRTLEPNAVFEHIGSELLMSGRLLIAAAGEGTGGAGPSPVEHPANCQSIIGVGAVDRWLIAMPSNPRLVAGGDIVNFVAPGEDLPSSLFRYDGTPGYGTLSGTSAATAVAAGVAALWAQARSPDGGLKIWEALLTAAEALPNTRFQIVGSGLLKGPPPPVKPQKPSA